MLSNDKQHLMEFVSGKTVSIGSLSNLTVCRELPVSQTVADSQPDTESLVIPVTVCLVTAATLCIITLSCLLLVFRYKVKTGTQLTLIVMPDEVTEK